MNLTPQQQAADDSTAPEQLWELALEGPDIAYIVARNPNTDPELLQTLALDSDQPTRQGVAMNPNTPTEVLLTLVAEFPLEVLDNPVFPLMFLERPDWFTQMPLKTWESLLNHEALPDALLGLGGSHPQRQVRQLIASARQTPARLLEQLSQDENYIVREAVASNPQASIDLLDQMAVTAIEEAIALNPIPEAIAKNPHTTAKTLARLVKAEWPRSQLMAKAVAQVNSKLAVAIAAHPNTPMPNLEHLATSKIYAVRLSVAKNPNTPISILERLADSDVRQFVIQNPKAPAHLLQELAQTSSGLPKNAPSQPLKQ